MWYHFTSSSMTKIKKADTLKIGDIKNVEQLEFRYNHFRELAVF